MAVDVDGTLLRTDLLQEAVLQFVARHPLQLYRIVGWLTAGKSVLKAELAARVDPGLTTVPLRTEVVDLISAAQSEGRPVYLASASDRRYIDALADRLGGIAGVFASDETTNLAGDAKANALTETFGLQGYDYVGDMPVDVPVWKAARRVLVVAHSDRFAGFVRQLFPDATIVARPRRRLKSYIKALRAHQWAKNALLFLALLAGHHFDLGAILATTIASICFCAAASSAYIVNDLLDLPGDRDHSRKRYRPFAAGDVPVLHGVVLSALLMISAALLAQLLPTRFILVLAIYLVTTLAYSLYLKRQVFIDVIVLGGLYTLRVLGGLAAITSSTSQWLLMFSLFLFLSLAIVKRCTELIQRRVAGKTTTMGRGYRVEDLAVLFPFAAASGYSAVLVFTLYMSSPQEVALYNHPHRLWLIGPLLVYWISRVQIIANRGELHDDPVIFAVTDRVSWMVAACMAAVIAVSI